MNITEAIARYRELHAEIVTIANTLSGKGKAEMMSALKGALFGGGIDLSTLGVPADAIPKLEEFLKLGMVLCNTLDGAVSKQLEGVGDE